MPTAKKAPVKKVAVATKASAKKAPVKKASANTTPRAKAPAKKAAATPVPPATRSSAKIAATKAPPAKRSAKPSTAAVKAAPPKKAASVKNAPVKAATDSAAAKSPAKKNPFDAKWLALQKVLLIEEKATYERQARNFQAEADELASLREPGDVQFDEESGEGDTLAVERERDLAMGASARHAAEEIDHALAKLDLGTYGICEVSGDPIPKERLEAIPWARERVEYKVGGFGRR